MFETQANVLHLLATQRQPRDIKIPDYHQLRTSVTQELWQAVLCDPVLAPLMQGATSLIQILFLTINMAPTQSQCILPYQERVNF